MPINTPTGYLDITNATLRGSKIVTTGYVGIANANPTNHLSIGSNLHINDTHSNVLQISGNINASRVVLGGITIAPTFDLEVITNTGNTTPNTLEFNNTVTAFVTTANATIGDTLTASKLVGDGSGISAIQSSNVSDFGSNVSRIATLETDLSDNSSRISNLSSNLSDNSSRITSLETDLSDNSSRITALESGDISISGDKTFTGDVIFESNVHMNGGNVLVANTINMTVFDPIMELGSNNLNTNDLGIIMTRHIGTNSNVAIVYDEDDDILRMGYTLNGASDSIVDLDSSNALAVSVQGELTVGSNLEVGTANLFVDTTTGKVGIGAGSPQYKLDVDGGTTEGDGDVMLRLMGGGGMTGKLIFGRTGTADLRSHAIECKNNVNNAAGNFMKFQVHDGGQTSPYDTRTGVMTLLGDGNVGIGTGGPDTKLHLYDASAVPVFTIEAGSSGHANYTKYKNPNSGQDVYVGMDGNGLFGLATGSLALGTGNSNIIFAPSYSSGEKMRITTVGNVGIGTASPDEKLDVRYGSGNGMVSFQATSDGFTAKRWSGTYGATVDNPEVRTNFSSYRPRLTMKNSAGTETIFISGDSADNTYFNAGNVGIGSSSPSTKLEVLTDTDYEGIMLKSTTHGGLAYFKKDGNGCYFGMNEAGNRKIFFQSGGLSYITGGDVGIGTGGPLGRLHVSDGNGPTNTNPTHTPPLYVTGNIGSQSAGSEFRHFNQSQGIGIAYNSVYATGYASNQEINIISRGISNTYIKNYAAYSDDRLKTNEEYITNATDTLMKLKPQIYDKHEEINVTLDNPIRETGLIAQDIYYDAPELRHLVSVRNKGIDVEPVNIPQERPFIDDDPTNDPDYSGWGTASAGVAYIQLVPYLIKSNQELKLKNDALEARIAALENV